jgi:hypothetical protein
MIYRKRWFGWLVLLVVVCFFAWRFLRPLNIFVVGDNFAQPVTVQEPEGIPGIHAQECGACHEEIYREWRQSIHAQAWTDEYFQVDRAFEGKPPVCDNCHLHLETQRDYLTVGFEDADRLYPIKKPNPRFDPDLQREGVTCAVCHLREGQIIGPYPTDLAPHPVKVDPAFLSGMSPCHTCHVVSGDRWDMFYRLPPCGTATEIRHAGQKPNCVVCHLPPVTRPVVVGGPARPGGRHLFQGGHHAGMVQSALRVQHHTDFEAGRATTTVTLVNSGAHHHLPTGTPDRHLTLTWRLLDDHDHVLEEKEERLMRRLMWRPFIVDLWDTRLPFNTPRDFYYTVDLEGQSSPAFLEVTVQYHLLEASRQRRIGYKNTTPIHHTLFHTRIDLHREQPDGRKQK